MTTDKPKPDYPEVPPGTYYLDEMDALARTNFIYKFGPSAYDQLLWRRPVVAAPPPARDGKGRFQAKKRSEMTVPEKAEFIAMYGIEKFNQLPYE